MANVHKKLTVNIVSESDISVQGHGVHTAYNEMASALEKRKDVYVIRGKFRSVVDCDVIHIHTIGLHALFKVIFRGKAKIVITAHIVPESFVGSIIFANYWLFAAKWYMKWFYKRADKVLAVSRAVADTLERDLNISKDKIEVSYNAINMQHYTPTSTSREDSRKKLGLRSDQFVVFGSGQVQPRKRVDIFIKMAQDLPDVQFIWAGGIPFKQLGADYSAMNRLSQNAPENMLFAGIIPHADMVDYLHAADVFCLPAEQENHPMCILEAAGAQLPIIARDIKEYDDTFGNDILRCTDDTFSDAVQDLQNAHQYAIWKNRSLEISKRFDSEILAENTVHLYQNLVSNSKVPTNVLDEKAT